MDLLDLADNQAESGVISTLVYHPEFILHSDYLKPGYFYNQDNGCIYWAISELYKNGIDNIDAFNISNMLSSNKAVQKTIEKYNLPSIQEYIDLCAETARHTLEEYKLLAQKITTLSYKRDLVRKMKEIEGYCKDETISLADLNSKRNDTLSKLDERYVCIDEVNVLGNKVYDIWDEICSRRSENGIYGMPSKFPCISKYYSLEPGELYSIDAKMKNGKSIFLLNEAMHKIKNGIPTLYIDREMSTRLFLERCLSHLSKVPVQRLKNGNYSEEEEKKIKEANAFLSKQPFVHIYAYDMSYEELYSICKILKHKIGLKFVIDDYLKSNETTTSENYAQLGIKANFLKNKIAGELNLTVMTAAQLNRSGEIADSFKINQYVSTAAIWRPKTPEEVARDGFECGNYCLKIYVNRLGEQQSLDDETDYLDFFMDGNTMTIEEATQHNKETEFD